MMLDLNAWDWLGFGLVLLALELVVTGIFLFWVGLAALTLSFILMVSPDLGWKLQLLIFGVTTVMYVLLWSYFGQSRFETKAKDTVNLNARSMNYIGQNRPLSEPITGGKGALIIDDSRWIVTGPELPAGAMVKIIAVNVGELQVEAVVDA